MEAPNSEEIHARLLQYGNPAASNGDDGDFEGIEVEGLVLSNHDLNSIEIRFAILSHCRFVEVDFFFGEFQESAFKHCHFDRVNFRKSNWNGSKIADCTFVGCDLSSIEMIQADLRNVVFLDCSLVDAAIGKCTMENVRFERCRRNSAAISGNDEKEVVWID
jgi:uncharacterized protein YjbI with pentapeptide repeats